MLLHYLVNTLSAKCTWNRWLFLCLETPDFIPPDLWHPNIPDLNSVDYKIWVSTRQKSVSWMNGEWSMSDVALNIRLSTWLLTTSVEDFEHASIRKEDNLNTTCKLTILILSVSVTFCVTLFVWLLPCYIFHSKSVPATSTVRPITVFVLQGSAAAKSGYVGRIYSTLGRRYVMTDMAKKLLKSDCNCQSYSNCYSRTLFWFCSFTCTIRWVHLQGSAAT